MTRWRYFPECEAPENRESDSYSAQLAEIDIQIETARNHTHRLQLWITRLKVLNAQEDNAPTPKIEPGFDLYFRRALHRAKLETIPNPDRNLTAKVWPKFTWETGAYLGNAWHDYWLKIRHVNANRMDEIQQHAWACSDKSWAIRYYPDYDWDDDDWLDNVFSDFNVYSVLESMALEDEVTMTVASSPDDAEM